MRARDAAFALVLALVAGAAGTGCSGKKKPAVAAAAGADAGAGAAAATPSAADPAAAADPGQPTRAECEQAVTAMQKVAPGLVPGDAVDLEDCLKLPRALVLCLHGAKSAEDTNKCVDVAAGEQVAAGGDAPAGGPADPRAPGQPAEPRASVAECGQMVAHYRSLVPEDERDEAPEAGMLAACTKELTSKDAACVLGARTLEAATTCLDGG